MWYAVAESNECKTGRSNNNNTTLKQGTADENAANVGSSKGSDQRENDK